MGLLRLGRKCGRCRGNDISRVVRLVESAFVAAVMVMLSSSATCLLLRSSRRRFAIAGAEGGGVSGCTSWWGAAAAASALTTTTTATTIRTCSYPPPKADPFICWNCRHLTTSSRPFSSHRVGQNLVTRPPPLFPSALTTATPSSWVSRSGPVLSATGRSDESGEADGGKGGDDVPSTWTYVPYDERRKKSAVDSALRRHFSSSHRNGGGGGGGDFRVPDRITFPPDAYTLSYARSSGPGGQNVNKLNTQAVLKFHVASASFLPEEVRHRLAQREYNRINSEGYLTLSSQEFRTQAQNRNSVVRKLEEAVRGAYPRPKVRKMRKGISKKAKEKRKEDKKFRSKVKANRKRVDF